MPDSLRCGLLAAPPVARLPRAPAQESTPGCRRLCIGLAILARGLCIWQRQPHGLRFPVVALAPHIAQGALQVGDPLLCGLEPDRGHGICVSSLERRLCIDWE